MTPAALRTILLSLVLLGLCGCAPARPAALELPVLGRQDCDWWESRVRIVWPEGTEPNWALDSLLAREVFAPRIFARGDDLRLWHFHRRAGRDQSGHQFSLLFCSGAPAAAAIFADLEHDPLLKALHTKGAVSGVYNDDPASPSGRGVTGSSDKSWPAELQRSWPLFITWVSAAWLDLVEQEAARRGVPPGDLDGRMRYYAGVDQEVSKLWHAYGQSSFFHQLSAAFGYKPLLIRKELTF